MPVHPEADVPVHPTAADVVRDIIENGWNRGDLATIDRRIGAGFVRHTAAGDLVGPEAFKARIVELRTAFAGFHAEIHETGGDPDRCYCRYTVTGRHTGAYAGFAPTGDAIRFDGAVVAHARAGRLIEEWEFIDTAPVVAQLAGRR